MAQRKGSQRPTRLDAEQVIEFVREAMLVLDAGLHVLLANTPFYERFRVTPDETIGRHVFALGSGQWDTAELRSLLDCVVSDGVAFEGFQVSHDFERIGVIRLLLNARKVRQPRGKSELVLLAFEDLTRRTVAEKRMGEYEDKIRLIFESVKDFSIFTTDLDGIIDSWNTGAENVFGYPRGRDHRPALRHPVHARGPGQGVARRHGADPVAARDGRGVDERWHLKKDGSPVLRQRDGHPPDRTRTGP